MSWRGRGRPRIARRPEVLTSPARELVSEFGACATSRCTARTLRGVVPPLPEVGSSAVVLSPRCPRAAAEPPPSTRPRFAGGSGTVTFQAERVGSRYRIQRGGRPRDADTPRRRIVRLSSAMRPFTALHRERRSHAQDDAARAARITRCAGRHASSLRLGRALEKTNLVPARGRRWQL